MSIDDILAQRLAEIVGSDHVGLTPDDRAEFVVHGQLPLLSVAPRSAEELAACVAVLAEAKLPLVPWGGGTHQRWGAPLRAERFVALHTARLNRVVEYEPDDLTISVEAGMSAAALDDLLAPNNQMLPLDPALPTRSTVGGILASACDGPRRLLYGTARDLLIGVRVVEATGRISKAGGMVVKNVSGFDMMKLYIGSLGSLAIIVSANFKLIPRPREAASLLATFANPSHAFAYIDALHRSQLTPAAVEFFAGHALTEQAASVALAAEGLPAAVARHIREATALAQAAGATSLRELQGSEHRELWAAINDMNQTARLDSDTLALRLGALPGDLAQVLETVRHHAHAQQLQLSVVARALNGVAYLHLRGALDALRAAHQNMLRAGLHLQLLGAPAQLVAELPAWGVAVPNLLLMRQIKQEFDPEQQLNPGRGVA